MIKAYIYPLFFDLYNAAGPFDTERTCRVEVTLPIMPKIGEVILHPLFDKKFMGDMKDECLKGLRNPRSIISLVLGEFRNFHLGRMTNLISGGSCLNSVACPCRELSILSDEELLDKFLFGDDTIGGFSSGVWKMEGYDIIVNDEHIHIYVELDY